MSATSGTCVALVVLLDLTLQHSEMGLSLLWLLARWLSLGEYKSNGHPNPGCG